MKTNMTSRTNRATVFTSLMLVLTSAALLSPATMAEETAGDVLFWSQDKRDTEFGNIELHYPTREIKSANPTMALPYQPTDLSGVKYEVEGTHYTLEDHMTSLHVGGLLVVHKGDIVYERYGLANDEDTRWIAFSVAKSVTSMLIGAAIQDGYIESVDDPVTDYLPRLKGGSYDGVTIENVLHMASGVDWNEDYFDPKSDVSIAGAANAMELIKHLNTLGKNAKPGDVFNYSTGDTNLVGAILRAAIGNNASAYLEAKIWQPYGMESDANWLIDGTYGVETGGCCLLATLRDYARIGLFAMNDGVLPDGTRVLPEGWMAASTSPSKAYKGYGYLWWLRPNGTYAAQGIFGQMIYINPKTETVIVTHSAWPKAVGDEFGAHRWAMVEAIESALAK